jgi:two-component sensor histidine kinase/ligand-binding sensor domain-containing protein
LLSPEVHDFVQDDYGRLWIATRGGISVYDGFRWESFTVSNGLPGNAVIALDKDEKGTIWALIEFPNPELCYYENNVWKILPLEGIFPTRVRFTQLRVSLQKDDFRLAIGTKLNGLYYLSQGKWHHYDATRGLVGNCIHGFEFFEGKLYVATETGLSVITPEGVDRRWNEKIPLFSQGIAGLAIEKTEKSFRLWLAGSDWLGIFQEGELKKLIRPAAIPVNKVYPYVILCPDKKDGVYFGNPNALYHYVHSLGEVRYLNRTSGLVAEGATALFLDKEKNLWVGSARGISKLVSERFANYTRVHGLLEDEVTAIQEVRPGWLVFSHNHGLTYFKQGQMITLSFKKKEESLLSETRVHDLFKDSRGNIWVAASDLGLGIIDQEGKLYWVSSDQGVQGRVYSVIEDGQHRFWVTTGEGLFLQRDQKFYQVEKSLFGKNIYLRKLFCRPSGEPVVVTGYKGFYRLEGEGWVQYASRDNPLENNVYAYLEDEQGQVWVGTLAGLVVVKDGRFFPADFRGETIDHPVYLLLRDNQGRLWIGTNRGVYCWDGKRLLHFDKSLGLSGDEINRSAGFIDSQGHLWFGTDSGVSRYQPESDLSPEEIPPPLVTLEGLEVGHQVFPLQKPVSLKYYENNLIINFRVTSFLDENKIFYRERLLGFEENWSNDRRLRVLFEKYTNLPPGRYVFQIQARNILGRWSPTVSSAPIIIHRAFWTTWWFILTLALLGMGAYYAVFRAITGRRYTQRLRALIRHRTSQLVSSLQEKEALLQEIHHRVKNNLQIVSSLLYLQSQRIGDRKVREIFEESRHRIQAMALIHEILYGSERIDRVTARTYFRRIVNPLIKAYLGNSERVRLDLEVDRVDLTLEEAVPCGLILNELVTNALKYAFPGESEGEIRIRCYLEPQAEAPGKKQLILVVEDNGVGLPPGFNLEKTTTLGLRLVRNLVRQLEGTIEVRRDKGTIFIIRIPR